MDQPQSTLAVSFEGRAAGRLAVGFILEIAAIGRQKEGLLDSLLAGAIIEANTHRLAHDPALQMAYAYTDTPPPDALRRPVSINALAASLRLPFETVRRHVRRLADLGICVATPQGVIVPTAVVDSPFFRAATRARYDRLFRFYDELREVNAVEPLPYTPLPADHPHAPVRAVSRIFADFLFRTIDTLHGGIPDPLSALVLLEVMRSCSEHLTAAQAETLLRGDRIAVLPRTPVRAAHIARRLDVPYETTRRHLGELIQDGFLEPVHGGVLPTQRFTARLGMAETIAENLANIRRMFRQLGQLGEVGSGAEAAARVAGR